MHIIKTIATLAVLMVCCSPVWASKAADGKYQFVLSWPKIQPWDMISVQQDETGYAKTYLPATSSFAYPQSLMEDFTLGDKSPLVNSMQDVVDQGQSAACKLNKVQLIHSQKNMILYTAIQDQCKTSNSVFEVIKSFNEADGNYSIVYTADPSAVSTSTLKQMKLTVESAQIT